MPRLIERFGKEMPAIDARKHLQSSNCLYARVNRHETER
jgi:hypothetical protein